MKKVANRIFASIAVLTLTLTLFIPAACAAENASYYFAGTDAVAYAEANGKIYIEGECIGTGTMDEIGIKSIIIYEQQSDGYYDPVHTYTRYNTSGMISYNNYEHFKSVTYQGTVGTKYYAEIGFYAKDSDGNETLYHDSNIVTAVRTPAN